MDGGSRAVRRAGRVRGADPADLQALVGRDSSQPVDTVEAILAVTVQTEVPGSDGSAWHVECDGALVGTMRAIRIQTQTWWQVTWPWRPGPVCDLDQARTWLAQYLLEHPAHPQRE